MHKIITILFISLLALTQGCGQKKVHPKGCDYLVDNQTKQEQTQNC